MSVRSLSAGAIAAGVGLLFAVACPAAAPPCSSPGQTLVERNVPGQPAFITPLSVCRETVESLASLKGVGQFASERPADARHESDSLIARVYPVADLVIPLGAPKEQKASKTQEDRLIQLITATISPQSWTTVGGAGCIDYFPLGLALVIRHTPDVHEQIADLLAALRRLQDVEVAVEVRLITVSDDCLEKLGIAPASSQDQQIAEEGGLKRDFARLDDAQVRLMLEAVQGDSRSNILQAPKLTVFNGQKASLNLTEQQCFVTGVEMISSGTKKVPQVKTKNVDTGLVLGVHPVVAPDNKTVTMELEVNLTRMDAPKAPGLAVKLVETPGGLAGTPVVVAQSPEPRCSTRSFRATVKLTDGTTALLSGWTQHREVRSQTCPPVLSKVPYIGQLFRHISYGKEREHLLVMVTPRIIVRHEEEEHYSAVQRTAATVAEPAQAEPLPPSVERVAAAEWPGPPAMHVNRRSIRLDYAVENVGPAGLGQLEVWYTRDAQEWKRHEEMVPAKGHATITVAEDGRWGFTLIAHSGTGMSASPPQKGKPPQVWVEVDTVAPQVELEEAVRLVNGEGTLTLKYHCEDAHLKEHPVTISRAPSPEGPWTVLARGQEAEGTFTCVLDELPHEFYVRIEAEDQAGNVGRKVSGLIRADVMIPQVRKVKVKAEE
jgi:hypothetical protein